MRHFLMAGLTAGLFATFATIATAQTAHVPGGYATIQAAVNSGATTVYVSDGTYAETVAISNNLTLLPEPPTGKAPIPFPIVTGLNITRNAGADIEVYVRGFHFTGLVSTTNAAAHGAIITIEGCRLDGGFQSNGPTSTLDAIRIRSCVITGNAFVYAYNTDFTGNMVWKGTATVQCNGGTGGIVRDNIVMGPATNGIVCASVDAPAHVSGNLVRGVTNGYTVSTGSVWNNTAEDCSGSAFLRLNNSFFGMTFTGNTVRRGGNGFDIRSGSATVRANAVDSVGGVGILTTGASVTASSNTLLHGFGDGIRISGSADTNVVGRGAARGIVASQGSHNTVFSNATAGLTLSGAASDTVAANIAYGNGTYGLIWNGSGTPALRCNDWFGNVAGATFGVTASGSDRAVDPLFCNLPLNDVHLSSTSPLLYSATCTAVVGALGSGCTSPTGVAPDPGLELDFAAYPNPSRGGVTLRWARSVSPSRIEAFDLLGRLRWSVDLPASADRIEWRGLDRDGHALPGGVYYLRRIAGSVRERTEVVLAR